MKNIEEGSSQGKPVTKVGNNTAIQTPLLMQELKNAIC
jgi:hypothetical protein